MINISSVEDSELCEFQSQALLFDMLQTHIVVHILSDSISYQLCVLTSSRLWYFCACNNSDVDVTISILNCRTTSLQKPTVEAWKWSNLNVLSTKHKYWYRSCSFKVIRVGISDVIHFLELLIDSLIDIIDNQILYMGLPIELLYLSLFVNCHDSK